METRFTTKIKIWGIVQGVGFRPFVAKLADRLGIRGETRNVGGLVEIAVTDTPEKTRAFVEAIRREKPAAAEIIHIREEALPYRPFERFEITDSQDGDEEAAMIPADLSVCPRCLEELTDEKNPRYGDPFISCMACGPRFTIIDRLPYDRPNTAMRDFAMCGFCDQAYKDRSDRRHHAQTISCRECGPTLAYRNAEGEVSRQGSDALIALAAERVRDGKVIAVKGVGGYNLICDPFQPDAVGALRSVKGRERKPFAVLFRDVGQIRQFCLADAVEEKLLASSARPILLLERKRPETEDEHAERAGEVERNGRVGRCAEFEKSRFIGAFLPGMGLHHLLLEACERPLIVTSANVSGLPMIKEEAEMFRLADQSDGLLADVFFHDRAIRVAADDSVVRVIDGQPQMIRRAKGYAPVPLYIGGGDPIVSYIGDRRTIENDVMILACGGHLKSAFALSKGPFSYVSQYFGDLDSLENVRLFARNIDRMKAFFNIAPRLVVCDAHPLYATTKYAARYAARHGVELLKVQHHHAHVASVMAEHNLSGPVIGVSFDGTGYGTDGAVWGGEFLICAGSGFRRAAHLKPIRMIGGDESMKDAWKSAMGYAYAAERNADREPNDGKPERDAGTRDVSVDIADILAFRDIRKDARWPLVREALRQGINTVESSSVGRLFDAVASLLDIRQENEYEGQCATLLEDAAARGLARPGRDRRDDLALAFHERVAAMIVNQCAEIREREKIEEVALTGGVFQNKILMERALALLRKEGFRVYHNISVSPNDGGLALGQNYIGLRHWLEKV